MKNTELGVGRKFSTNANIPALPSPLPSGDNAPTHQFCTANKSLVVRDPILFWPIHSEIAIHLLLVGYAAKG